MSNSRFLPYTRELNKQEITRNFGRYQVVTSPMEKKTIGNKDIYYTTITGLGNDLYLMGVMNPKSKEIVVGMLGTLYNPTFNYTNLYDFNRDFEEADKLSINTYAVLFDSLLSKNISEKSKETLQFLKGSGAKDRRLYYNEQFGQYFDGETHAFIFGEREGFITDVMINEIVSYLKKNLYGDYSVGDQAQYSTTNNKLMKQLSRRLNSDVVKGNISNFGGKKNTKKLSKKKSKTKKSKRKYTRNNKYKNKSMKRRTTNGNRK